MTDQELIDFLLEGPMHRKKVGLTVAEDIPQIEAAERLKSLSYQNSIFKRLIDSLPDCNNCYKQKATRYEIFQEYNKFSENYYNDHVWRCDDCGPQIYELNYAAALREFLKLSGT